MQTSTLNVLLIYFPKQNSFHKVSSQSNCFDFLFWFISDTLLSKVKSLFFNLSTSRKVNNLSTDYGEKHELFYNFKDLH